MEKNKVNILINALPKSASLYIVRTIVSTLGCEQMRIGTRGVNHTQTDAEATYNFLQIEKSVSQDHIAPTKYNLDVLYYCGLRKFVVVVRDPRDALVSWAHHLERSDVVGNKWHWGMLVSSGIISENYYSLTWKKKLDVLIENYYPIMLDWIRGWAEASSDNRFELLITTYERFALDKDLFMKDIFDFYDLNNDIQINWPSDSKRMSNGINLDTHFRKGVIGNYINELSPKQINLLNSNVDQELFKLFNWNTST